VCTISLAKTPSETNVCDGSSVEYTYVVHNNSDYFTWSGSLSDDTITLPVGADSFSLAPSADATFKASADITGAVTNKATASGNFNDPASSTASAEKSATVTAHTCSISITKTPSVTNICTQGGEVTYTYVVTNDSDFFNASGSVSDDVYGSIGSFGPLAPGASATLTKVATVKATVTNTGTANATFDDPASTTASAEAEATVTAHICTISLTKTPNQMEVCNGASVDYTYVVTNNSDFFTWTGTLSDDKIGSIDGSITLDPEESQTFTASGTINGTVTNIATASGTFNDPANTDASATATATVIGQNCSQITPTSVTCSQFKSGMAPSLSEIQYSLKDGVINQTNPGVFYYWVNVSGSGPFTINQSNGGSLPYFPIAPGAFAFDSSCNSIGGATISQDESGNVTISGSGIAVIGVKYNTGSVVGESDPGTVTYTFVLYSDPTSSQSIGLVPK
jgi:hypothetical protein